MNSSHLETKSSRLSRDSSESHSRDRLNRKPVTSLIPKKDFNKPLPVTCASYNTKNSNKSVKSKTTSSTSVKKSLLKNPTSNIDKVRLN